MGITISRLDSSLGAKTCSGLCSASSSPHHLILNTDVLLEALHKPEHVFAPKLLSSREIVIPKALYGLYLMELFRYINQHGRYNPGGPFDVTVVDNTYTDLPPNNMILAIGDLFTYICPETSRGSQQYLLFTNPSVTADAFQYLEGIWQHLPEENKDATNVHLILRQLLAGENT